MLKASSESDGNVNGDSLSLRPVLQGDFHRLAEIYNHYIEHSIATFEEQTVCADQMGERVKKVQDASLPWLVAEENGRINGYAYAGPWNVRSAYRYTVECSIYLDPNATGRGIGVKLYQQLFDTLREQSLRVVIGGVSLPNAASVALHEKFGFRKVAHFQQVGFKFGQWIDVGYWQLSLGDAEATS